MNHWILRWRTGTGLGGTSSHQWKGGASFCPLPFLTYLDSIVYKTCRNVTAPVGIRSSSLPSSMFSFLSSPENIFSLPGSSGGGEKEGERQTDRSMWERNIDWLPSHRRLGWELNPWPFGLHNNTPTKWATPARAPRMCFPCSTRIDLLKTRTQWYQLLTKNPAVPSVTLRFPEPFVVWPPTFQPHLLGSPPAHQTVSRDTDLFISPTSHAVSHHRAFI